MGGGEGGERLSQKQVIPSNWTVWSSYESKNYYSQRPRQAWRAYEMSH